MQFELLCALERVRTACRQAGYYETWPDQWDDPKGEHLLCQQLEAQGLIREGVSEPGHSTWTMV